MKLSESMNVMLKRSLLKHCLKLVILSISILFTACKEKESTLTRLEEFRGGKTFAVPTGTAADQFVLKKFPDARIEYYNTVLDCALAVKDGKADGAVYDLPVLKNIVAGNPGIVVLPELLYEDQYGFAVKKEDTTLKRTIDKVLVKLKADGTYESMQHRWFPDKGSPAPMPVIPLDGKNGVLRFGTAAITEPMSFVDGNRQIVGFDVEFATYIARETGQMLEIVDMEFGALLPALMAGKVDMIGAGLSITEERAKKVLFSDCYYPSGIACVVRSQEGASLMGKQIPNDSGSGFMVRLSESFHDNIIHEKRYLHIFDGLRVTLVITLLASFFGTLVGGGVCFMRMSTRKSLSGFAKGYISLVRGVPVLVLLMIIYYVVFASIDIDPLVVAVIGFGLNFGAYVSEMFRTSIESIDKGQWEAAIAGGFTKVQAFRYIILPQAVRRVLPVYKGELISLLKMTSIVGYIAVQDLTKAGDIIRSRTFDAFFPLFMIAVLYLLMAWLLAWGLSLIEFRVDPISKRIQRTREDRR